MKLDARECALRGLDGKTLPGWPADLLRPLPAGALDKLEGRDRALAEQIEIGVVKNLLLLQDWIALFSKRQLKVIDPLAQKILAVGLYQLAFLDRVPESAAVNEAVNQAKRLGRAAAAGFINAVLRNALRSPEQLLRPEKMGKADANAQAEQRGSGKSGATAAGSAEEKPNTSGAAEESQAAGEQAASKSAQVSQAAGEQAASKSAQVSQAASLPPTGGQAAPSPQSITGDVTGSQVAESPRDQARRRWSHPTVLFDRMAKLVGPVKALATCRHNNSVPPLIVRLARGAKLTQLLLEPGQALAHEQNGFYLLSGPKPAQLRQWSLQGLAQAQDPTAGMVVDLMQLQEGMRVLDRCCGRGTKTLQIRELVGAGGRIIAIDPAAQRTASLAELAAARGIENIQIIHRSWLNQTTEADGEFDRILLDVPCSNSGVLARRPEARYAQDEATVESLCQLQRRLLDESAGRVRRGGLLVYSTCSLWSQENELQVQAFLQRHGQFKPLTLQSTWPSCMYDPRRYRDGGYVAVLRRE